MTRREYRYLKDTRLKISHWFHGDLRDKYKKGKRGRKGWSKMITILMSQEDSEKYIWPIQRHGFETIEISTFEHINFTSEEDSNKRKIEVSAKKYDK